jgi:peptide/nickel transport system permease protein
MQPAAIQRFQQQRRDDLIHLYRLDRPFMERILYRTWNTLTFNFGKSTIIKSSRGEREVLTIVGDGAPAFAHSFYACRRDRYHLGIILGLKKARSLAVRSTELRAFSP